MEVTIYGNTDEAAGRFGRWYIYNTILYQLEYI